MVKQIRSIWEILKQTVSEFLEDKAMRLSAALAYYTIFSLPGLIIIVIWVSDLFLGKHAIEGTIYSQIADFVGSEAAMQIQVIIRNAALSSEGYIATIIGAVTLVIGATTVFGEIQDSINYIWRLKAKPKKGWLKMLLNRLLSFSMIISLSFLMLVSLLVNGLMDALIGKLTEIFPEATVVMVYIANTLLTFLITSLLFGIIFKVLPDARIRWKHVRAGAFTTALLFMIGKFLISYYLGQSSVSSVYGAAGSVIIILLWVYYSSIILYFGATFTRVYAQNKGGRIYPNEYAVWVKQVELESEEAMSKQP
ncbi:MAG TPA: YihY/virulence factor BrkB family protein [Parasegetibacter sp.]